MHILLHLHRLLKALSGRIGLHTLLHRLHLHHWLARLSVVYGLWDAWLRRVYLLHGLLLLLLHRIGLLDRLLIVWLARLHLWRRARWKRRLLLRIGILHLLRLLLLHGGDLRLLHLLILRILRQTCVGMVARIETRSLVRVSCTLMRSPSVHRLCLSWMSRRKWSSCGRLSRIEAVWSHGLSSLLALPESLRNSQATE